MVERLYDSQDACARLSHAIAAMTADKATRIAALECGLAAEQQSSAARIVHLEAQLSELREACQGMQERHIAERERLVDAVAQESNMLQEEIKEVTANGELQLAHAQKALAHTQEALELSQRQHALDSETLLQLRSTCAELEDTLRRKMRDFDGLEHSRRLHNDLVDDVNALREKHSERMRREIDFLDSYKADMHGADAQVAQLFEENQALTTRVAQLEARLFDADDRASSLAQALSQHMSVAEEREWRLTRETKRCSAVVLVFGGVMRHYDSRRAHAAWLSQVVHARKMRAALAAFRAAQRRKLISSAAEQLALYARRHAACRAACNSVARSRFSRVARLWLSQARTGVEERIRQVLSVYLLY
jgi:chromosome segregation ATPase